MITKETIDFMRKLDVKEIHGYDAAEGLKLIQADALAKISSSAPSNIAGECFPQAGGQQDSLGSAKQVKS